MWRRNRIGVAQRLGRDPVLAVSAVEVAAQHPEAHCQRAGQGVEERLLLDGIQLKSADVSVRNQQPPAAIEAHAANAVEPIEDHAPVTTREAAEPAVLQALV